MNCKLLIILSTIFMLSFKSNGQQINLVSDSDSVSFTKEQDSIAMSKIEISQMNLYEIRRSMYNAGSELKKYTALNSAGYVLMLSGLALSVAGTSTTDGQLLGVVGGVIAGVGFVLNVFVAPSKVAKAGQYLRNGGISIPLNKKRIKNLSVY